MAIAKITKRSVDAAIKEGVAGFLWDADVKGFGLRIAANRSSYVLQYRMGGRDTPTKRYTIGAHGSPWTPELARARAADLLALIRVGTDPMAQERDAAAAAALQATTASLLGFTTYADAFLRKRVASQKRGKEVESIFTRDLKPHFGSKLVTDIRKTDVNDLLDKVSERNGSAANKAHKALKTFFAWAVARDTIAVSPMAGLPAPDPDAGKAREHTLSPADLRLAWLAAGDLSAPFDALVRMLIATGQRLREVAGMTWLEIDEEKRLWTIPKERTKNETTHLVPLSPLAWDILKSIKPVKSDARLVFTTTGETPVSGFSKAKSNLDALMVKLAAKEAAEAGAAPALPVAWRFHDLRRTLATGCERIGTPIAVTEAILNHRSGSKRGIVGVYQRHSYSDEKRSALTRWADEVGRIAGFQDSQPGTIVDLQAERAARAA